MNKTCLTGRITKDPELRTTSNGTSVCSFTVAVDRPNVKDTVDFIDCVAWRESAEFVSRYFKKGDGIEIEGHITTRSYEDKNSNKRKTVEVVSDSVFFPKGNKRQDNTCEPQTGIFAQIDDDEIKLPF